jgi:predicted membrane channel-forming protein YqfA (hemolysin III family)
MNARLLAWLLLPVVGLVVVGWLALWLLGHILGLFLYALIGVLVVAGAVYVVGATRRALSPGTRARRRLDAASETYRMRDR